jgi:DNA-binding MarR family transcriptional regulator
MPRPDTLPAPGRLDDVHALSDELARLMRVVHALKAQFAASGSGDAARERAAHVLLFPLTRLGPLRQGALAELLHADPSTVSRHVTLLVERGLVRRVADASDGRVSRLVVTPSGEAVTEGMKAEREALFAKVTEHWADADLAALTGLLHRFVEDLTTALPDTSPTGSATTPEKDR